ncbi:MAG: RrF2 family transcriptional regulator [Planctomycetota bacterium]|jgi:Rrf2 family protein
MLLTRKSDYALVALAALARHGREGASARDLAEKLHLPLPVLRNILKLMANHGLLKSTRGPSGGYRLARPPNQITLADVVKVIEGPVQLARCCPPPPGEDEHQCRLEDSCQIKTNVRRVHESLLEFLNQVTLAQIAGDQRSRPLTDPDLATAIPN